MKNLNYARIEELLQEAHKGGGEASDDIERANTSDAAQSGKKPKMGGKLSDSPRKGEVRVPEVGATLPRAKVHPMRRLGQILGKMARISGSAPESVDLTRRR